MSINEKVILDLKLKKKYAFNLVYQEYYRLVYYIALDITRDEQVSQDVLQETFIKLMNDISNYQEKGSFKQYLASIAKSCALNAYKKRKQNKETLQVPLDASYNEDYSKFELTITLNKLLSPEEAKIVYKKVVLEDSFQDIADELNQTLGVIQAKYYRAMKILKKYYEEEKLYE